MEGIEGQKGLNMKYEMKTIAERILKNLVRIWNVILIVLTANLFFIHTEHWWWKGVLLICFAGIQFVPSWEHRKIPKKRLRICANGCELLILFLISAAVCLIGDGIYFMRMISFSEQLNWWELVGGTLFVVLTEAVVFWNGILRVYATSAQIGIKWRITGLVCGWIPVVNLVVLRKLIQLAYDEVLLECDKIRKNQERCVEQICDTRYPILMVHGVFFRDFRYFNYWGRIPAELSRNGARIYYGNHQSAASVADSGRELAERIHQILKETGCEKVNIIAHSKGGLDCRYALSCLGMAPFVASLTTINTPHRGCIFADYLLNKIPKTLQKKVASGYNKALKKMGDEHPDFMAAVTNLTASFCRKFNEEVMDCPGVFYQSVGSKLNVARSGRFPLNFTHHLVKYFDGANDGLVSETSFPWGEKYTFLTVSGKRGISHGDMIDLNRENIAEFDVREFYVKLVQELKERGF